MIPDHYCSNIAQLTGEPLHGSASFATTWLILEYSGEWRAKATNDNDLPASVQCWLADQAAKWANSRVLFVKQARQTADKNLYVATTTEKQSRLCHTQFESFEQLVNIDSEQLAEPTEQTLFLVCTNGKRDQCCAKFGLPVYGSMAAFSAESQNTTTWQSTHLGGHRYAATMAVLPAGIYYGYLAPHNSAEVVEATKRGEIALPYYRGRTFYDGVTNAADYFLRQHTQQLAWDWFRLLNTTHDETATQVRFVGKDKRIHRVELVAEKSEPVLVSCSPTKAKPQPRYRLLSCTNG